MKGINDAVESTATQTARAAVESFNRSVTAVDEMTDATPGVGHAKAIVGYALRDNERGDRAMKSASRTTGVLGGGVAGFLVGGPVGAIAGGVSAGAAMDGIITGVDSLVHSEYRPNGQIAAWTAVHNGKSADDVIGVVVSGLMTPIMDGLAGRGAGKSTTKYLEKRDMKIIDSFQNEEGSYSLDDVFNAQQRISKRNLPGVRESVQIRKNIPDSQAGEARYGEYQIPEEAFADQREFFLRGDKKLLRGDGINDTMRDGIDTKGSYNDAFLHQAENNSGCNFVSTSKSFRIARGFGTNERNGDYAIL